jgi:hypothetical protein
MKYNIFKKLDLIGHHSMTNTTMVKWSVCPMSKGCMVGPELGLSKWPKIILKIFESLECSARPNLLERQTFRPLQLHESNKGCRVD